MPEAILIVTKLTVGEVTETLVKVFPSMVTLEAEVLIILRILRSELIFKKVLFLTVTVAGT